MMSNRLLYNKKKTTLWLEDMNLFFISPFTPALLCKIFYCFVPQCNILYVRKLYSLGLSLALNYKEINFNIYCFFIYLENQGVLVAH